MLTDADGFFEVELNAESDPGVPGGFGYVYAWRDGYESDVQILPIGTTSITKNLRLPRVQTIDAGQSTTISVVPDSAHCFDPGGEVFEWTRRCGIVRVTTGTAGTLFVEARATGGGPAPSISFNGNYSGLTATTIPGTASVPVRAGSIFVSIGVPSGTAQKFDVFTSLR